MNAVLDGIKGKLIASCQAYPGEPMRDPRTMAEIAQACQQGGAAAIRGQGLADLALMRQVVSVPIIGLWKDGEEGIYITPTLQHALSVATTGCEIVAIDATRRPRRDDLTFAQTVAGFKQHYPDVLVMADCGSLDDALAAQDGGADIIGTTLAGYTGERPKTDGPDYELIEQVVGRISKPVVVEGRVHNLQQAAKVMNMGAFAVCVGTAITHPTSITRWFVDAIANR